VLPSTQPGSPKKTSGASRRFSENASGGGGWGGGGGPPPPPWGGGKFLLIARSQRALSAPLVLLRFGLDQGHQWEPCGGEWAGTTRLQARVWPARWLPLRALRRCAGIGKCKSGLVEAAPPSGGGGEKNDHLTSLGIKPELAVLSGEGMMAKFHSVDSDAMASPNTFDTSARRGSVVE